MRNARGCLLFTVLPWLTAGVSAQEAYIAGGLGRSNWNFACGPTGCERNTTGIFYFRGADVTTVLLGAAYRF